MTTSVQKLISYLPSLPSSKKIAGIGVALVIISSLGAYLYFCGPYLPMSWKFAAVGIVLASGTTVVAFIILRNSGTEKAEAKKPEQPTATLSNGTGTSKTEITTVDEKDQSIATTQETPKVKYDEEYVQAIEHKIQSYNKKTTLEDYEEIKQYLSDLHTVEETFGKTFIDWMKHSQPLISIDLALRLIKDFADNEPWLTAMVKGTDAKILDKTLKQIDYRLFDQHDMTLMNPRITLYEILLKNEKMLIEFFAVPRRHIVKPSPFIWVLDRYADPINNRLYSPEKLLSAFPDEEKLRAFLASLAEIAEHRIDKSDRFYMILQALKNDPNKLFKILSLKNWNDYNFCLIAPLFTIVDCKNEQFITLCKTHDLDTLNQFLKGILCADIMYDTKSVAREMILLMRNEDRLMKILELNEKEHRHERLSLLSIGRYLTPVEQTAFRQILSPEEQLEFDNYIKPISN